MSSHALVLASVARDLARNKIRKLEKERVAIEDVVIDCSPLNVAHRIKLLAEYSADGFVTITAEDIEAITQ